MTFAVRFDFLFGYGGQVPFGHAALYELGAYGAVLSMTLLAPDLSGYSSEASSQP